MTAPYLYSMPDQTPTKQVAHTVRKYSDGPHYVAAPVAAKMAVDDPISQVALTQEDLEKRLSWKLEWLDKYLTPEVMLQKMERTSLKDLAIFMGITMEKLLLMRGQPTSIVGTDERKTLEELGPALLREIQRRERVKQITVEAVSVVSK